MRRVNLNSHRLGFGNRRQRIFDIPAADGITIVKYRKKAARIDIVVDAKREIQPARFVLQYLAFQDFCER
jgi:hypothetical protein